MKRFVSSVQKALDAENWYGALYMALTLPDICARIESDDGKTNGKKFIDWFNRYPGHRYRYAIGPDRQEHVFLSGTDCYALRCALLHEGGADITVQRCREALERFHFTVGCDHCNQFNMVLQLDVSRFCLDICEAVLEWEKSFRSTNPDKVNRFDSLIKIFMGEHEVLPGIIMGG